MACRHGWLEVERKFDETGRTKREKVEGEREEEQVASGSRWEVAPRRDPRAASCDPKADKGVFSVVTFVAIGRRVAFSVVCSVVHSFIGSFAC